MKSLLAAVLCVSSFALTAQEHKLTKLWETEYLPVPESALPDFKENLMYVSLIKGSPFEKDDKGGIAKVSLDGKVIDSLWVTGLSAPKGLGKFGNRIYAADLTEVAVVDVRSGKIVKRIQIDGAEGLNDVTVDSKGVVYVSDSKNGNVYRLKNEKPELWLKNEQGVNGVKAIGSDLYFMHGPILMKADSKKKLTKIADGFAKGGDGLEPVKDGEFLVTCWAGLIYYVHADGKLELLMDTQGTMNTADLGFDPEKRIIYLPTFNKNSVIAYQLQ